jgi:monovalent cation:H+ antiporter-2, CPA2 family
VLAVIAGFDNKILTTGISVRALGYKMPVAAASALMLAQIGEFSFVLERAGREVGLSPPEWPRPVRRRLSRRPSF